jgi:hypothetical protein
VSGKKQLYQPEKPVVYIVPITSILGRLPLIPAGDHGIILAALGGGKQELFPLGKCDEDGRQGTDSRLYYISSWAMCWPTDHPKKPVTDRVECAPSLQSLHLAHLVHTLCSASGIPMHTICRCTAYCMHT